jgi:hypothetical protein
VDDAFIEKCVQVGFNGGAGCACDSIAAVCEVTADDFLLTSGGGELGELFIIDDAVKFVKAEFSPAAMGVHIFEGGAACLDEHIFAVICFDGGVAAGGLGKRGVLARGV